MTIQFNIPDSKAQYFIDCFAEGYDLAVEGGYSDTINAYAKQQALLYLAKRVKDRKKAIDRNAIPEIDILTA